MQKYLLVALSMLFLGAVNAGLGGSFSESLDEDTDNGIHPECSRIHTDAYIAQAEDGYQAAFLVKSPDVDVGYVDIHWSIAKYGSASTGSQELHYRMNRSGRGKFENVLPSAHVDSALQLGDGDFVRYYFRYWAVPHSDVDNGFMCNTEVKWFGSALAARDEL